MNEITGYSSSLYTLDTLSDEESPAYSRVLIQEYIVISLKSDEEYPAYSRVHSHLTHHYTVLLNTLDSDEYETHSTLHHYPAYSRVQYSDE